MSDLPTIYIREPIITDDGRAYSIMRDPTPGAVAYVPATCLAAAEAERVALTDQRDYWRNKAKAYGNIVHGCGPDLSAAGHPVDASQADGAVGGIARAVRALVAERDEAVQRAERLAAQLAGAREVAGIVGANADAIVDALRADLARVTKERDEAWKSSGFWGSAAGRAQNERDAAREREQALVALLVRARQVVVALYDGRDTDDGLLARIDAATEEK